MDSADSGQDKVIEKIRKLLAMADDTASPNEALIAARRARKLMDKHQISREDIEEDEINSQFLESVAEKETTQRKKWLLYIAMAVGQLNDCTSVVTRRPQVKYKFRGFKADAIVAKMTMDYLVKACERQLNESQCVGASERNFFRIGFSEEIYERAVEIKAEREKNFVSETGTALVPLKEKMVKEYFEKHFGKLRNIKTNRQRPPRDSEVDAYTQGQQAGRNTGLEKQVEGEESEKLS